MPSTDNQTRTFVKKVGDETVTRQVTSPQAEVEAKFEGFVEQAPAKSSGGSSRSASSSTAS
jgi:hypothetical protein